MNIREITTRLTDRFGPRVADWCAGVPVLAGSAATRWGLTLGDMLEGGASSVTMRCVWPDGRPAVLKLSPEWTFMAEQVAMLRLFAASGRVPAVLGADPGIGVLVLEAIEPGTAADELPQQPSPYEWAELIAALHKVDPPSNPPRYLRDRSDELFTRIGRRLAEPAVAEHLDHTDWNRAMRRCDALLRTETTRVLLHGDLHLGNVLDGGPARGLVAIDPKVCVGDPCFDAVDYVLEGAGRDGVDSRCELVAHAYGLDGDRLHAWCRVVAPLLAVARIRSGRAEQAVVELLALSR